MNAKQRQERNWFTDTLAVSPVVAVILMVAITVVLAATVFVLVADIGNHQAKPVAEWNLQPDEAQDRFNLQSASSGADWSDLQIQSSTAVRFALTATAVPASTQSAANAWTTLTATRTPARAGDYLDLCGDGGLKGATHVVLRDAGRNAIIGAWDLSDVAAC